MPASSLARGCPILSSLVTKGGVEVPGGAWGSMWTQLANMCKLSPSRERPMYTTSPPCA